MLENISFRFYPLHNLDDTVIFPKKDTVTELHEFGNGITLWICMWKQYFLNINGAAMIKLIFYMSWLYIYNETNLTSCI